MSDFSELSTYKTGILQARASRNLRFFMSESLKPYGFTTTEWSLLGVVSDESKNGGIRVSVLAALLDVETSFITNTLKKLLQNGYVIQERDVADGRAKVLRATDEGHLLVVKIEQDIRRKMRIWLKNVENEELLHYITVLSKLSRNTAS